jgi:hypothetical protein
MACQEALGHESFSAFSVTVLCGSGPIAGNNPIRVNYVS